MFLVVIIIELTCQMLALRERDLWEARVLLLSPLCKKIIREDAFDEKKKRPGLKFNPGSVLIGLRITEHWK